MGLDKVKQLGGIQPKQCKSCACIATAPLTEEWWLHGLDSDRLNRVAYTSTKPVMSHAVINPHFSIGARPEYRSDYHATISVSRAYGPSSITLVDTRTPIGVTGVHNIRVTHNTGDHMSAVQIYDSNSYRMNLHWMVMHSGYFSPKSANSYGTNHQFFDSCTKRHGKRMHRAVSLF